jgi:hypothetical protein
VAVVVVRGGRVEDDLENARPGRCTGSPEPSSTIAGR